MTPEERREAVIAELELAIKTQTGQDWCRTDPLYMKERCLKFKQYQWPAYYLEDIETGDVFTETLAGILAHLQSGALSLFRHV